MFCCAFDEFESKLRRANSATERSRFILLVIIVSMNNMLRPHGRFPGGRNIILADYLHLHGLNIIGRAELVVVHAVSYDIAIVVATIPIS